MKKGNAIRLGCIGGGMIINVAHVPAYVDLRDEVILTAIYSPERNTAEETRKNYLERWPRRARR